MASVIPLYLVLDAVGLLNSRTGLLLCYASTSVLFAIFQLRPAFESIPIDLEEAAVVDGATQWEKFAAGAMIVNIAVMALGPSTGQPRAQW